MALPTLDPLWGPNNTRLVQDRSQIRARLALPASDSMMVLLTEQMNSTAKVDPPSVAQVQEWLDEILNLEQAQADEIDSGTAHLGNASSYEGLKPGTTLTREEKQSQVGKLQWDTSLDKVRYEFGSNPRATVQGQREERINLLTQRIATTLNLNRPDMSGGGMLLRS